MRRAFIRAVRFGLVACAVSPLFSASLANAQTVQEAPTAEIVAPGTVPSAASSPALIQVPREAPVAQGYGPTATEYPQPELIQPHVGEAVTPLTLADVVASVYSGFPMIQAARLQRQVTAGQVLESYGAYDTKLQAYSLSETTGFYRNFRNGIGVARQTWWGGYVSAGYRVGRGDFQPWYKERETNEGGEFKLAFVQPLLQGRAIDPQRVAVFQASLANRAAEPEILQSILEASHEASSIFWQWVASGAGVDAQRELLDLAVERGKKFEFGVKEKYFREVDLVLNRLLIAERTAKAYDAQRKYQATAIKLSLYLRDEVGQPIVPDFSWVPRHFPVIKPIGQRDYATDLNSALARRPEPALLKLAIRSVQLDRQLAQNNMLPSLDLISEASQDAGIPASSTNDKGQFELLIGIQSEVPLQRSKARGKRQSTAAKQQQLLRKMTDTENKIGTELSIAYTALNNAEQIVDQQEKALMAAIDTLSRYQSAFEANYDGVDLIYINLLESKVTETEIKLVNAQAMWFTALADMQAALGLNPLDQAMAIAALPESKRSGPGFLPKPSIPDANTLKQQWQKGAKPAIP